MPPVTLAASPYKHVIGSSGLSCLCFRAGEWGKSYASISAYSMVPVMTVLARGFEVDDYDCDLMIWQRNKRRRNGVARAYATAAGNPE